MKASSLAWVRLNSVPVIRATKSQKARAFVAGLVGYSGKLKSLDGLTAAQLKTLNHHLSHTSNNQLEAQFLEHLKGVES